MLQTIPTAPGHVLQASIQSEDRINESLYLEDHVPYANGRPETEQLDLQLQPRVTVGDGTDLGAGRVMEGTSYHMFRQPSDGQDQSAREPRQSSRHSKNGSHWASGGNVRNAQLGHHRIMESTQSSISRIQPAHGYRCGGLGSVRSSAKQSSQQSGHMDSGRTSLRRNCLSGAAPGTPSKQPPRTAPKSKASKQSSGSKPYTSLRRRSSQGSTDAAAQEQRLKIEMIKKKYSRKGPEEPIGIAPAR